MRRLPTSTSSRPTSIATSNVCPKCGQHHKIDARSRIANLLEPGYELVDLDLKSTDPLNFYDVKPYKSAWQRPSKRPASTTPS